MAEPYLRRSFIPDALLYPKVGEGDDRYDNPSERLTDVEEEVDAEQDTDMADVHGNVPKPGTSKDKTGSIQKDLPTERHSQLVCSDILFLESIIYHIKDCDAGRKFAQTIIAKLQDLIRHKLRNLTTTGSGSCVEDKIELLFTRVSLLKKTIMDKHWDEYQTLRTGPSRQPARERHSRRPPRYDDQMSYSSEEMKSSRRNSNESDELSSAIDRFDKFITMKYKNELKEVRRNSMPRLHRRQSTVNGAHDQNLAERILRSRKTNRNEYSSPRSISGMGQMTSPDSIYSQVSAHSPMKGYYSIGDGVNRSPPDGGSYHEEILDIVASVNGKPNHVTERGVSKRRAVDQATKSYVGVETKSSGQYRRESEELMSERERYYSEGRPMGFPQLDQPLPYRDDSKTTPRHTKAEVHKTRSIATQSDIPPTHTNLKDKKKKKKGRPASPRTNRTSWMRIKSYDNGPAGECNCDRSKKRDDKQSKKKTDTSKRFEPKTRHQHPGRHDVANGNPGDIPRPRAHETMPRYARGLRRGKDADMEMTAMDEIKRKYESNRSYGHGYDHSHDSAYDRNYRQASDNRHSKGHPPRHTQSSPHNGGKFMENNIVKSHGYYSDIDDDYIRQYRSLQL